MKTSKRENSRTTLPEVCPDLIAELPEFGKQAAPELSAPEIEHLQEGPMPPEQLFRRSRGDAPGVLGSEAANVRERDAAGMDLGGHPDLRDPEGRAGEPG